MARAQPKLLEAACFEGVHRVVLPAVIPFMRPVSAHSNETQYSLVAGSFSTSFDLWVTPNTRYGNAIQMVVLIDFRQDSPQINDHALESYVSQGFIDPVITIDPAQAGQYALNVSSIPMAPVPEASTLAMMFSGLSGLLLAVRRRSAAGKR